MIKEMIEFMVTGIMVIVGYLLYCVSAVIVTFLIGMPIGIGIHLINELVKILFNGA